MKRRSVCEFTRGNACSATKKAELGIDEGFNLWEIRKKQSRIEVLQTK